MSKANRMIALAATVSIGLALAGCQKQQGQAGGQPAAPPPVEVGVATIEPKPLPIVAELPGRTNAYRVAEVRPQVNGIILKRLFREGADVKAGDQLYQIDPSTYQVALASAQADMQKAEANLQAARNKAGRYNDLIRNSVVSRQDVDDVNAALKQGEAQVAAAKAAVDLARINLDYTKVFAPISGRIGKSAVTEGALVMANQATGLATIQQLDPLFVDVTQTAGELMRLRQDLASGRISSPDKDKAAVTLFLNNGGAPYPNKGELQFSDVTVDQGTSSVQLRAVVPNPNMALLPGLFVRARIEQGVVENAVTVPQAALARRPDGSAYVWVVGNDNKVSQRTVATERAVGAVWLLSEGLNAGDRIVVEGLQKIKPGAEVKTVPARATTTTAALPEPAPKPAATQPATQPQAR